MISDLLERGLVLDADVSGAIQLACVRIFLYTRKLTAYGKAYAQLGTA